MSGTVVEFPQRRGQPETTTDAQAQQEARRQKTREARQRRLSSVPDIVKRLESTNRTQKSDRPLLARNLGRIVERANKNGLEVAMPTLFEMAFGQQAGEANYKKRKRFIRFDEDGGGVVAGVVRDGDYTANAKHYLDLADALAKLTRLGEDAAALRNERERFVLALIEGTSFDERIDPQQHLRGKAVNELLKRSQQIVDAVEQEVDLDYLRVWTKQNVVEAVIDPDGEIIRFVPPDNILGSCESVRSTPHDLRDLEAFADRALNSVAEDTEPHEAFWHLWRQRFLGVDGVCCWGEQFDLGMPYDAEESWSHLSPRVVIGYVYSPIKTRPEAFHLGIDAKAIDAEVERQRDVFERVRTRWPNRPHRRQEEGGEHAEFPGTFDERMVRREVTEREVARTLAESYGLCSDDVRNLYDVQNLIENCDREPPRNPWKDAESIEIWLRRRLELQLRYDPLLDRWRLCLALVHGSGWSHAWQREGAIGPRVNRSRSREFVSAANFGNFDAIHEDGELFFAQLTMGDHVLFAVDEYAAKYDYCEFLGMRSGCLPLPSTEAVSACLTELADDDDLEIEFVLDDLWDRYAPAPHDTLAGKILRNLAYAPEEKRVDRLLIADARRKYELLRSFAETQRREYEDAMARLDKEDS